MVKNQKIELTWIGKEKRLRLTKGYTTQVAVDAATREMQFVSPPIVFANLERACAA